MITEEASAIDSINCYGNDAGNGKESRRLITLAQLSHTHWKNLTNLEVIRVRIVNFYIGFFIFYK